LIEKEVSPRNKPLRISFIVREKLKSISPVDSNQRTNLTNPSSLAQVQNFKGTAILWMEMIP